MGAADRDTFRAELRGAAWWALPQLLVLLIAFVTMPYAPSTRSLDVHRTPERATPGEVPFPPAAEQLDPAVSPAATPSLDDQWAGKVSIDGLLRGLWFEMRNPRSSTRAHSDLMSLLRHPPVVSVINLWAPGCEPCKREFPEFRKLQAGWGREVRFVSVQLGKDDPGELLPLLPPPTFDLHDIGSGTGTIREQLAALGLVAKNATIPLTMVLDCRNQLRWLRTREITDMNEFAGVIKQLQDELGTASCPAPEPVVSEPAVSEPAGPRCGNARCETGETSETCCTDCPCAKGSRCENRGGRSVCAMPVSGLQD